MNPGNQLGPYSIVEKLGEGGMGEVWLAEDTRLGRQVAIKVLPEEFAADPERLARFEQEARASAALNHPNIAAVFDVGQAETDGATTHYMVQELLSGHTLRTTLESGPLPLKRVLALGVEIAEALRAAHKAGIVHRDLKPDNVFVTEEGHAKVLDFGLAKLTEAAAIGGTSQTMSPTVLGTQAGSIMGTAGYMAPEQVTGEEVDHRADLFAFGCVFYEMVFDERAFSGRNVMQTLDLILAEPPRCLAEWPADKPQPLRWILGRCLEKDPERRCQSAADLVADLGRLGDEVATAAPVTAAPSAEVPASARALSPALRGLLTAGLVLAAALAGGALTRWWSAEAERSMAVAIPIDGEFMAAGNRNFAISPDGRRLVYVGGDSQSVMVRQLSTFEPVTLPGTEGADSPFFSPDGEWVAYVAAGNIYKVLLAGGGPQLVASAPERVRGTTWTDDGMLLLGSGVQTEGIFAVPASGASEPVQLRAPRPADLDADVTALEQGVLSLERPHALPGSDWFVATREAFNDRTMIVAISRDGAQLRELMPGWDARYADGTLYVADDAGGLVAVPFDAAAAELRGTPFAVPQRIATSAVGATFFDVAANGTLVFLPAESVQQPSVVERMGGRSRLVWTDMNGLSRASPNWDAIGTFSEMQFSADGEQALMTVTDPESGSRVQILDVIRWVSSELPIGDLTQSASGVWAPDGRSVIFAGNGAGVTTGATGIYRQFVDADPGTPPQLLHAGPGWLRPRSLTPDGSVLALTTCLDECGIYFLELTEAEAIPFGYDEITGRRPAFSPDGTLLAYVAREGDRTEAFVRPFPGPGGRVRVSRDGAMRVIWARDGKQVYYSTPVEQSENVIEPPSMMVATIEREPTLRVTSERTLFEASGLARRFNPSTSSLELLDFDITNSGNRFLTLTPTRLPADTTELLGQESQRITLRLITGWSRDIQRLIPGNR